MPASRVLGVGPMKSGSTVMMQALGAATQLSVGFDCDGLTSGTLVSRASRRLVPLELILDVCHGELFHAELVKDPWLTSVARRLAEAWPPLSGHGGPLKLYFMVRSPTDCTRSFLERLNLTTQVASPADQHFSWNAGRFPHHFTAGMQRYLDVADEGLEFTGYVDAAVQRWVLFVDEYLRCPSRFVLVRYEDFVKDPVSEVQRLVHFLGLSEFWTRFSAERVREAASMQYQVRGQARDKDPETIFGRPMLKRIWAAVGARARLLGYSLGVEGLEDEDEASATYHVLLSDGVSDVRNLTFSDLAVAQKVFDGRKAESISAMLVDDGFREIDFYGPRTGREEKIRAWWRASRGPAASAWMPIHVPPLPKALPEC